MTFGTTCGIIHGKYTGAKGRNDFSAAEWEGGLRNPNEQEVSYMTMFETLYLMLQASMVIIALITLIVMLIMVITNNEKK